MAGMLPYFLTGANAKIKLNNVTLAFCTNLSYEVTVKHQKPYVLGMYEPNSIEPLSYSVSGSFSVIRYAGDISKKITEAGGKIPSGVNEDGRGNGIGTWGISSLNKKFESDIAGITNSDSADGRANNNLNPASLFAGTFFNIDISQRVPDKSSPSGHTFIPFAKIKGCRIVFAGFSLDKRGIATQNFKFEAKYADEDSFLTDFSGVGQHLDAY